MRAYGAPEQLGSGCSRIATCIPTREVKSQVRAINRKAELEWLDTNRAELEERFAGQWVAISRHSLVATGPTLREVLEEARSKGFESPFIAAMRSQEFRDSAEVACLRSTSR